MDIRRAAVIGLLAGLAVAQARRDTSAARGGVVDEVALAEAVPVVSAPTPIRLPLTEPKNVRPMLVRTMSAPTAAMNVPGRMSSSASSGCRSSG